MKNLFPFIVCLIFLYPVDICQAQVTSDYAVMLTATVDSSVPSITLKWPHDPVATSFIVYRKSKTSTAWDMTLATLPGSDSVYTDFNIVVDSGYEYQVQKNEPGLTGYGYIYSGIRLPPVENRGKLILLTDAAMAVTLAQQLSQLMSDISGDGWEILRHDVPPGTPVPEVKSIIEAEFNSDPANVKCLFIFGHVAVPYSGDSAPDGHTDHIGAWPADVYYGDMPGMYTDQYVNDISAARPENHNIPGDGKWDQSQVADMAVLEVGRVDLYDMPSFPLSESGLLMKYLIKDHAFRTKKFSPQFRGLIDDQFGVHGGEAFAANGWRNFPVMVGRGNVEEKPYFATLQNHSYILSYACGGGWYQGAGGIGSTTDFVNDSVLTVFTMLFGSYFGDWDNQDNFLRAPLASSGYALTSSWAGRPNWQFHHMALGETIGYSTRLSQNNSGTYLSGFSSRGIHIALMGDPTLRLHVIAPVGSVTATSENKVVKVEWTASTDPVIGYYVYRSQEKYGAYSRISPQLIQGLSFTDSLPVAGINYYMVRAMNLQSSPSGSYFNLSTGITDSVMVFTSVGEIQARNLPGLLVYPNPVNDRVNLEFDEDLPSGCRISLMDVTGRQVFLTDLPQIVKYHSYSFPVAQLPQGFYMINAVFEKGTITRKLEVAR